MSKVKKLISTSPEETFSFGSEYAKELNPGDVTGLFGNLGSGKTQFVKGICNYFDINDNVNSPTFIIVNEYSGRDRNTGSRLKINHFDLYRLNNINELIEVGPDNYMNSESICLIEWAELADKYLNGNLKKVYFEQGESETERIITLKL